MARWFRLYDDILDDPKVQRLSGDEFKSWVNVLCLASKHGGSVPPLAESAFALRLTELQVAQNLGRLAVLGLLDETAGIFRPHNWAARQFSSDQSNQRVRRMRNGGRNGVVTAVVTAPESETEAETERKICPKGTYPNDFEAFWKAYPTDRNMSKKSAFDVFKKLSASDKQSASESLISLKDYLEENKSWYRCVHAVKYLRDRRWEGHAESARRVIQLKAERDFRISQESRKA